LELNVARSPCPIGVDEVFKALHEYASVERYPKWAYSLLAALGDGISASYLRDGLHLAGEWAPHFPFDSPKQCEHFSREVVENVLYRLPDDNISEMAMTTWEAAAKLAGFCEVLAAIKWSNLTPIQANELLRLLIGFSYYSDYYEEEAASWQKKWRVFKKHILPIEARAISEEYLEQWRTDFDDFITPELDNAVLAEIMKEAATLAKRLAQPPYRKHSKRGLVFGHFIRLHDATLRQRVLDTPAASLKALDKACRRDNETKLIAYGVAALVEKNAAFAVDCLWHAPKKLVKTAQLLGIMNWAYRLELLRNFVRHPIMTVDFESLSLREIYDMMQTIEATRHYNPIPKALKNYFEGKRTLRDTQLQRHRQIVLDRLLQTKLQVLENITEQALWRGFETTFNSPDVKHALQLFRDLYSNKRACRRFLKAYTAGNANYLYQHPLTLIWIKQHPHINLKLWTEGIILDNYEEKQYISITLEPRPLEVLKMGTYVGSCLGLGGIMTDSAVAIMLDINKQVLYARNENGIVIARQLIAISKDDQLVAFQIYPHNTASRIKKLFFDYDQHFAHRLGIKLFKSERDNYEIEHILSEYWWDDGAWHFGRHPRALKKRNASQKGRVRPPQNPL
ncbi:MAG: hypothetical protein VSS75_027145, partial [Candidatus Parabeggiatoa sp.]|nr:hypothetical protein [Candidatus Parabeggiatoa sp.]